MRKQYLLRSGCEESGNRSVSKLCAATLLGQFVAQIESGSAQHVILPELRAKQSNKVTVSDENWLYNKMDGVVDETRPFHKLAPSVRPSAGVLSAIAITVRRDSAAKLVEPSSPAFSCGRVLIGRPTTWASQPDFHLQVVPAIVYKVDDPGNTRTSSFVFDIAVICSTDCGLTPISASVELSNGRSTVERQEWTTEMLAKVKGVSYRILPDTSVASPRRMFMEILKLCFFIMGDLL